MLDVQTEQQVHLLKSKIELANKITYVDGNTYCKDCQSYNCVHVTQYNKLIDEVENDRIRTKNN